MNVTSCDASGNLLLGEISLFGISELGDRCKPGVDCPGDIVEVPIPPCVDTDDGRDYITPGIILSGADIEDMCMGDDILRERYCNAETTYTSEDVSCSDEFGEGWICDDRECVLGEGTTTTTTIDDGGDGFVDEDTATLCSDDIDNDGDGDVDCADEDCWKFSICDCGHGSEVEPPDCIGHCDTGTCTEYETGDARGNWCECVPYGEVACGSSNAGPGISCDGWCLDDEVCIHDYLSDDCYCNSWYCVDGDGGFYPEIYGCIYYEDIVCDSCNTNSELNELTCIDTGPYINEVDCEIYGDNYGCVSGVCEEVIP